MTMLVFQKDIGGTEAFTKRIMKTAKRCGGFSSIDTFFVDRWFRGVKTVEEANAEVVDYSVPVALCV